MLRNAAVPGGEYLALRLSRARGRVQAVERALQDRFAGDHLERRPAIGQARHGVELASLRAPVRPWRIGTSCGSRPWLDSISRSMESRRSAEVLQPAWAEHAPWLLYRLRYLSDNTRQRLPGK